MASKVMDGKVLVGPTGHHLRGMSQWPAILACPCFSAMGGSKNADVGTACHLRFAEFLQGFVDNDLRYEVPEVLSLHEMGAMRFAKYVYQTAKGYGAEHAICIEERVVLDNGVFGTADAYFVSGSTVAVFDFKTFWNPARDYTAQLSGYALGVARGEKVAGRSEVRSVVLTVGYGDRDEPCVVRSTVEACRVIADDVMGIYDGRDGGAPLFPISCAWCELCVHHVTCSAAREVVERTAVKEIEDWCDWSVERKAQALVLAEAAMKWADAVRAMAKADLLAGLEIADAENSVCYVLRESAGRKTPRTVEACRDLAMAGVAPEDVKGKLRISAADCKLLLRGVGLKAREADRLIDSFSDVGAGSVSMVRG